LPRELVTTTVAGPVLVDFPACIARDFPDDFPTAWRVTSELLEVIDGVDLTPLARRSPSLKGFEWPVYLRCSVARSVRVTAALRHRVPTGARVLDFGSYFGNFSVHCRHQGYQVDAIDSYRFYESAFKGVQDLLRQNGVQVIDFDDVGLDCSGLTADSYDAILCMGVIEHIPHTPRPLLESLKRLLRPQGVLIFDTPNLAYFNNRKRLARGEPILAPIEQQYHTEIPFEGHHREYTEAEVRWMLTAAGFEDIAITLFNYSFLALKELNGSLLEDLQASNEDPSLREVIFGACVRPG